MRWSAAKLRWFLLGSFLLLAVIVAGFFSVARYRAGMIWQRILARNGVNLRQETNGFTYSQSSHGRTVFTLHAGKARPEGRNKWMLQDVVLILYGHEPGRDDRIYGKQFEYDQEAGVARAVGEVHMDLQTPEPGGKGPAARATPSLTFGPETETQASDGVIHVRTSGLVYMRKLGLAATGQPAEFRYGGVTCTSTGAEFDTGQSVVRLLADVRLNGIGRGRSFALLASHAELHQREGTANLSNALLTSGDRQARADAATLHLKKNGDLASAEASGSVELHRSTEILASPQITATFGAQNRPQQARLFPSVRFTDTDRARPAQGSAGQLELAWLANGALTSVHGTGNAMLTQTLSTSDGATTQRHLQAAQVMATFAPGSGATQQAVLQQLDQVGQAEAETTSTAAASSAQPTHTVVKADRLTTSFAAASARGAQATALHGLGHTSLEEVRASGARQHSTGDSLAIMFAPGTSGRGEGVTGISSAVQEGHVALETWSSAKGGASGGLDSSEVPGRSTPAQPELTTGHADRATYAQNEGTVTLTGQAGLQQSGGELAARTIVLHQATGDAEASGEVTATSLGREDSPATHIVAGQARLLHAAGLSIFQGTTREPAQLWQGGSQVQAAEITLENRSHGLSAGPGAEGGLIHAVFAAAEGPARSGGVGKIAKTGPSASLGAGSPSTTPADRSAVRVAADRMQYDDQRREAVFVGDVHLSGATGDIAADRGTAFLAAPADPGAKGQAGPASSFGAAPGLGGSLDRAVLSGNVRLLEPGRTGTGEQLTYQARTGSYILTGTAAKPPRITGEQGSAVTGATLLFRNGDSTIVIAGAKADHKAAGPARVHAETDLK